MTMQNDYKADGIGHRIARYRRFSGYATAADLARAIGNPRITAATIANIESGRRADVSVLQLIEIASTLGISPTLLLTDVFSPLGSPDIRGLNQDVARLDNAEMARWLALEPTNTGRVSEASIEIRELVTAQKGLKTLIGRVSAIDDELNGLRRNGMGLSAQSKTLEYEVQVHLLALEGTYLKLKNHELVDLSWFDTSILKLMDRDFDFERSPNGPEGD